MDSVIFKKMEYLPKSVDGTDHEALPLFGFAVDEYLAKYDIDPDYAIEHLYIFGAVLEHKDINDDFFELMLNNIMQGGNGVCMLVFDVNNLNDEEIRRLRGLEGPRGFEELNNCYEDRIVFARI